MSRTDKDRPNWVRANDPDEFTHVEHHCQSTFWRNRHGADECVVGSHPAPTAGGWRTRFEGLDYTCWPSVDHRWYSHAPGWFVTFACRRPARHAAHQQLTRARALANGGADLDDFDYVPHRFETGKGAAWMFW